MFHDINKVAFFIEIDKNRIIEHKIWNIEQIIYNLFHVMFSMFHVLRYFLIAIKLLTVPKNIPAASCRRIIIGRFDLK